MRVCDFIIFETPFLTVEIMYVADHTVKIGISNIIKSQTLTVFTLFRYFLNQARTGQRPAHAWFLKITSVRMYVCVCGCVCVRPPGYK